MKHSLSGGRISGGRWQENGKPRKGGYVKLHAGATTRSAAMANSTAGRVCRGAGMPHCSIRPVPKAGCRLECGCPPLSHPRMYTCMDGTETNAASGQECLGQIKGLHERGCYVCSAAVLPSNQQQAAAR